MKKSLIYTTLPIACIVLCALMLNSCKRSLGEEDMSVHREYLAVSNIMWSIINKNGQVVLETDYRADASSFSNVFDDVYWVRSGNSCQLFSVNQPNQPLIDEEHANVADFICCDHTVMARNGEPLCVINTKGETIATLPEDIKTCSSFSRDGYAIFQNRQGSTGVIDKSGQTVIEPNYRSLMPIIGGTFLTDSYQILDSNGKVIGEIDRQRYALQAVPKGGGIIVSDAGYGNNRQWHVLNKKGEKMFTMQTPIRSAQDYRDGYLVFIDNYGRFGVADEQGNETVNPQYDLLFSLGEGEFIASQGRTWGIINAKDETLVEFNYSSFDFEKLGDNYIAGKNYKYFLIDRAGNELASFRKYGTADHPFASRF